MKLITPSKALLLIVVATATMPALAQKGKSKTDRVINIPMEPAYWEYDTASIKFITNKNVKSVYVKNGAPLYLKNQKFANGTIEYDVEFGGGFPGISFRMTDDRKNGETFYLRYFGSTSPESRTTLQYSAVIDGMSIWDLSDEYQAGAKLVIPGWNHVKLVLSGKQMKAYVNDMSRPALIVPELEGGTTDGGIFFLGGQITIANLVLRPDATEGLDPAPGYQPSHNDTRYLRRWQVTPATDFPYGTDVVHTLPYMGGKPVQSQLPDSTAKWTPINAESRGMVNLTRIFGGVKNNARRLSWLKTTIASERAQDVGLKLGFSDEIWLFVNGQAVYVDKNHFGSPEQKFPNGRCTIENATVRLPLKQGKNEIMIALANYFYGWGVVARLDDTGGLHWPAEKQ